MGRARKKTRLKSKKVKLEVQSHIAREIGAVVYLGLAILFFLVIRNSAGPVGERLNNVLRLAFGVGIFALPVIFFLLAMTLFFARRVTLNATKYIGLFLLVFSGLGLVHMRTPIDAMDQSVELFGGWVGFLSSVLLRIGVGTTSTILILIVLFLVGILLTFEVSFRTLLDSLFNKQVDVIRSAKKMERKPSKLLKKGDDEGLNIVKPNLGKNKKDNEQKREEKTFKQSEINIQKPKPVAKKESKKIEPKVDENDYSDWQLPPLDLLSSDSSQVYVSDKVLKANAEKIRQKLSQFGIEVTMKDVNIGPTVLQYTLQPDEGVKLNKITGLKNDLALALAAKALRIEAPIPGKALVGIEVPNDKRMTVHLREMLESEEFASVDSKLKIVIGRDVSGAPVIDDLASMPHLMIAGATGSGKSVGMNTFLLSLLYQNSPRDLKFIMVDPKRVELTPYNGIPHLLTPVITDPEKAHAALKWAVAEMNRRYQELADKGYKNIKEYNEGEDKTMHSIVMVVDELADLMMQSNKKETEAVICRLAQMARAVGMHLILATQRPSVDVITGVIKANIPTRIAFSVTSGVDSRTVLDTVGAEDLLGMGDMLFMPKNLGKPIRVQGVYVSTKEIERVTNRLKLTIEPTYDESIVAGSTSGIPGGDTVGVGDGSDQDDLFHDAVALIKATGKASASLFQRRLSVGYARAARILDILEEHGLVGPANGAKPREIFISEEE